MIDMTDPRAIEVAAADWAARTTDPDFLDWTGLTAWLGEDPERNHLYNEAMIAIEDGVDALKIAVSPSRGPGLIPGIEMTTAYLHRSVPAQPSFLAGARRWTAVAAGSALAAAVAGLLVFYPRHETPAAPRVMVVEAPAHAMRRVSLPDGSRIEMAGGSRVTLTGLRVASIDRGRALFTVRHDEKRPFAITVGRHKLLDAGTVFEVVRRPGEMRVSVAEGAVVLDPRGEQLRIEPGLQVVVRDQPSERQMMRVPSDQIGRWRQTSLSYLNAPLTQVADDLSGSLGLTIRVSPALAERRFTGTLVPSTLREQPNALGGLLDIQVDPGRDGWNFQPR